MWDDIYDDDYLDGMCRVCGQDYADDPSELCGRCQDFAYDSIITMMNWLTDTDIKSDYLSWYYDDETKSFDELNAMYELEPMEDKVEALRDYAKDHYRAYEEYFIKNQGEI